MEVGDTFTGFCVIRKKELKHKQNGEPYLILELGDRSGRLRGKLWKNARSYYDSLKVGMLIKIQGKIQTFLDRKEIRIQRVRVARKDEQVELEQIVPKSKKDIDTLKETFREHLKTIQNEYLNRLLEKLFPDEDSLDEYLKTPSGKLWHHNYLYGLLEHIVCMLDLAEVMKNHYPRLQMDLVKTAIILHNFGKKIEYGYDGFIDYSTEGRLIGHIVLGFQLIQEAIRDIPDFPEALRLRLLHLILSHQGGNDQGSPVVPMTLEAIVLHQIDELDIKTNAFLRIMESDRLPDSEWTRFNNLLNRFIYVGDESDDEEHQEQND